MQHGSNSGTLKIDIIDNFTDLSSTAQYSKSNQNPKHKAKQNGLTAVIKETEAFPMGCSQIAWLLRCVSLLSQLLCSPVPQLEQLLADQGPRTPRG